MTIRAGDTVKVTDDGQTYDTFIGFFEYYRLDSSDWDCNRSPRLDHLFDVVCVEIHPGAACRGNNGKQLALIQSKVDKRTYVVGVEGLELVTESTTLPKKNELTTYEKHTLLCLVKERIAESIDKYEIEELVDIRNKLEIQ
ncbi:hypothetical protein [Vibrio phage VCPH]|nr:hypothetical protein [Vibrio phage VCPH]